MSDNAKTGACPICGGGALAIVSTAIGERAYCQACFHGWRLNQKAFAYSSVAMCSMIATTERQESQAAFIEPFLRAEPRVLEIGCAGGELAATLRQKIPVSWYEAIEPSPMANQARAHVDRLHTKPMDLLLGTGELSGDFDLVVMSHLLEHLPDPAGAIRSLSALISPAGALFLEVPNRSGHLGLPMDDNISHLHFFSPTSLLRLLASEGFEPHAVQTAAWLDARYTDSLRVIARRFQPPQTDNGLLGKDLELSDGDSIVVWGAGSVALEVLANFFDTNRIDYFIDSNPTKHGSTCLGRPVLGPEALDAKPRTVLIASVDFADAIRGDILRLYPDSGHRLIAIAEVLDRIQDQSN